MTTADQILALARTYVEELDAKRYSRAHQALTLLAQATRALPSWLEAAPLDPAAEVERTLACGARVTLRNEDGTVVLVVRDEETVMAPVMTQDEAKQLRGDVARVMAAGREAA